MNYTQFNTTKKNCQACTFIEMGVKTRKNIPHTCKLNESIFKPKNIQKRIEDAEKIGLILKPNQPQLEATYKEKETVLKPSSSVFSSSCVSLYYDESSDGGRPEIFSFDFYHWQEDHNIDIATTLPSMKRTLRLKEEAIKELAKCASEFVAYDRMSMKAKYLSELSEDFLKDVAEQKDRNYNFIYEQLRRNYS